jgi:hypothetical protein
MRETGAVLAVGRCGFAVAHRHAHRWARAPAARVAAQRCPRRNPPWTPAPAGRCQESLRLFQQATALNPQNLSNLKQASTRGLPKLLIA